MLPTKSLFYQFDEALLFFVEGSFALEASSAGRNNHLEESPQKLNKRRAIAE